MFYPKIFTGRPLVRLTICTIPFIALVTGCSINSNSQGGVTVSFGSNNNGFNLCDASVVDQTFERDLPSAPSGVDIGGVVNADFRGNESVNKAKVTVSGIQPNDVKLSVVNGRLVIVGKDGCGYTKIDATVLSQSALQSVRVADASKLIDLSNTAEVVYLQASDASNVSITTPNSTTADIHASDVSKVDLRAQLKDLKVQSSDSSDVTVLGVDNAVVTVSDAGHVDIGNVGTQISGTATDASHIDVGGNGNVAVTTQDVARVSRH
jgi:hypothetical protein